VTPSLAQQKYDHSWESSSYIKPYVQRDHSWNIPEFDHSHEKKWDEETKNPTHYQVTPSLIQTETDSKDPQSVAQYDHKWESKSIIIPYKVRDHAWNHAEHDNTNFYDFRDDAPKGYGEDMTYEEPHPTNIPYKQPEDPPEACEAAAVGALKTATTAEEMKVAKEAVDKCVAALKKQLEAAAEENKDAKGPKPKKDAPKKGGKKKDSTPAGATGPKKGADAGKKKDDKKEDDKKDGKKENKKKDADKEAEKSEKKEDKKDDAAAKEGKEQKDKKKDDKKGAAQISARTGATIQH